jgi:hypothetical protein
MSNLRNKKTDRYRYAHANIFENLFYRPILRTKSEPDLAALVDEDIQAMRERLVKRYGKGHQRYLIKGVPRFSRRQWLVLASLALVDFTSFCAMSILAPFYPSEVSF